MIVVSAWRIQAFLRATERRAKEAAEVRKIKAEAERQAGER